jgi:hypothetical protein
MTYKSEPQRKTLNNPRKPRLPQHKGRGVNHTVPLPLLVALLLVPAMLLQACTAGQPGTASPAATLSPTASGDPAESTPEATPASVSENAGGSDASVPPSKPTPKSANDPSTEPSPEPSDEATPEPAAEPTADPSDDPTPAPTSEPAVESTATPSTNQPADPDASPADPEADADGNDANNTDNGTATPPPNTTYLQKLPTPEGLAPGVRVAASDSADLDGNGTIENVYLLWDTNGELLLQVTTGTMGSDPVTRRVLGPEGLADNLQGPVVSALLLERFSEYDTRDIAIGFSSLTYGDSQWMLYRHVPGEPLQLMIQEPYAVDTGTIAYRDEDGDGRFERMQYPGHVVRVSHYEESVNGFTALPIRSFSTETFNWESPADTARGWLYLLYNRIEPDYSRLMNRPAPDQSAFSMTGYPDIFTPYPSWDGNTAGSAFTDIGAPSWQGLPSAEATVLTQTETAATVRLSHVSEFDETRRAAVTLELSRQNDGTWSVARAVPEIAATLCVANDEENQMVLTCEPVFLSAQQAAEGYGPLRDALARQTGIILTGLRQEGSAVTADLSEEMRFFLNEGSTGATMRMNTLIRTLLSLPNAKTARVTIAGEADVEMDHYSLKGSYTLNEERALTQTGAKTGSDPTSPEGIAEALFAALANEEYELFAQYADPDKGTTLAIYGFVTEDAPVFDSRRWLALPLDGRIHQFGYYDGTGFPILASSAEWLHLFFTPHRERGEWERTVETEVVGSGMATPQDIWPDDTHITFFWAGSEPYDGMDWRSLTFVMTQTAEGWRLRGLVSNQWTI